MDVRAMFVALGEVCLPSFSSWVPSWSSPSHMKHSQDGWRLSSSDSHRQSRNPHAGCCHRQGTSAEPPGD
jgi:hypothetical protein